MSNSIKWVIGVVVVVVVAAGFFVLRGGESETVEQITENSPANEPGAKVVLEETELTEPIKVGAILSLTGPASFIGKELQNGLLLASKEINGAGTQRVELFIEDSATKAKEGVSAFNRLENTVKPDIYISATSSVSMALASLAEQNRVPLLGVVTAAPKFTQQNEYTWRYFPTTQDHVALTLDALSKNKIEKAGIIYINDDFGNAYHQQLQEGVWEAKQRVIGESFLPPEKDFRTQLIKIISQDVGAMVVIGNNSHIINIFKQLNDLQFNGVLIGHTGLSMPSTRSKLGNIIDGAFASAPMIYDDEFTSSQLFMSNYEELYGEVPSHFAGNGYDALKLLADAYQPSAVPARERMLNYLKSLTSFDGMFGPLKIDSSSREITFELYFVTIQDGEVLYL